MSKEQRLGVGVVLEHKNHPGKILLVEEGSSNAAYGKVSGQVCIPLGHLEDGEDFLGAASRESIEETGYSEVKINHLLGVYQHPVGICVVYIGEVFGEQGQIKDGEIKRAFWYKPESILKAEFDFRGGFLTTVQHYQDSSRRYPLEIVSQLLVPKWND